jgi:hypothetical protein
VSRTEFDPASVPLVAALRPLPPDTGWSELAAAVAEHASGLAFTLEHPIEIVEATEADVVGVLTAGGTRTSAIPLVARALADAQHPASRLAGRRLRID